MTVKEYSKLVRSATGFVGGYPLTLPLKVGHYYEMRDDGTVIRMGSISDFPQTANLAEVSTDKIGGSETYYAGCKRRQNAGASGGVTTQAGVGAEAKVTLDFTTEAGFVLAYEAAEHTYIDSIPPLQKRLKELLIRKDWRPEWVLVTEVITAASTTLAVSAQSNSTIELSATVTLPGLLKDIGIANPDLGWVASNWQGSGYTALCKAGTPLYHCLSVRNTVLGPRAETLGPEAPFSEFFVEDEPFQEPAI